MPRGSYKWADEQLTFNQKTKYIYTKEMTKKRST